MRRACPNTGDLVCFYTTVIRPVLEYACPVWHSSLTKKLTNQLESQQVRALRIIFGDMSYEEALDFTGLQTLEDRRESIAWQLFMSILHPDNCLNKLLPERRNQDSISRLQVARSYPLFKCRSERFKNLFNPMPYLISKVKQIHFLILFFFSLDSYYKLQKYFPIYPFSFISLIFSVN